MKKISNLVSISKKCSSPETTQGELSSIIKDLISDTIVITKRFKKYFLGSASKNPNISLSDWLIILDHYVEENLDETFYYQALNNPVIDLWLLEDVAQWEIMSEQLAKVLLELKDCSRFIKDICRRVIEETKKRIKPFSKFVFPVMQKVFPSLLAHEIVSVQSMSAPVGNIFYLNTTLK